CINPLLPLTRPPLRPTLFPYTTLFRSQVHSADGQGLGQRHRRARDPRGVERREVTRQIRARQGQAVLQLGRQAALPQGLPRAERSEEHTSELQSRFDLVCRLLLEKRKI